MNSSSHAAFGFINPPRGFARDSVFMGGSTHPSKRGVVVPPPRRSLALPKPAAARAQTPAPSPTPPPTAAAPPRPGALIEHRCEYLEAKVRQLNAQLREYADEARDASAPLQLRAMVKRKTVEYPGSEGAPEMVRDDNAQAVPKGTRVHLCYPMEEATLPSGARAVVMRRLVVDPVTAAIECRWLVVYKHSTKEADNGEYLVGDFEFV